jgi:hypothetical protein
MAYVMNKHGEVLDEAPVSTWDGNEEGWELVERRKKGRRRRRYGKQGNRYAAVLAYNAMYRRPTHIAVVKGRLPHLLWEDGADVLVRNTSAALDIDLTVDEMGMSVSDMFIEYTVGGITMHSTYIKYKDALPSLPPGAEWMSFYDVKHDRNLHEELVAIAGLSQPKAHLAPHLLIHFANPGHGTC